MGSALLPPSVQDARTKALAELLNRLDTLPLDILRNLHNPALCPVEALPFLARAYGVLEAAWGLAASEAEQRALVGQALLWQRHRGTPWALSQVLTSVGWPGGLLEERIISNHTHNGAILHNGDNWYAGVGSWANFRVRFDLGERPLSPAEVALFRVAVAAWSPVGRHCAELLLRLQLSGGLNPGRTAGEAVQIQVGTVTKPVTVDGNLVTGVLRRSEAQDEDLRQFVLLDAASEPVAAVTRDIQLIHHDHTLLIQWSL
jgi:phage tail P2-like protein